MAFSFAKDTWFEPHARPIDRITWEPTRVTPQAWQTARALCRLSSR